MKSNIIRDNYIYFTNLDTVKCNQFELTINRFFTNMLNLINRDVSNYNVSYDNDKNQYIITYNGKTYIAKYGKNDLGKDCEDEELISILNTLVDTSTNYKKLLEEDKEIKEYKNEQRAKILEKIKDEVIVTQSDKEAKLYLLEKEYEEKKFHYWKEVLNTLKRQNTGTKNPDYIYVIMGVGLLITVFLAVILSIFGLRAYVSYSILASAIFATDAFSVALAEYHHRKYLGLFASILSILRLPFTLIKQLVKKINLRKSYKEDIKEVKKSLVKINDVLSKKERIFKKPINVDELKDYIENIGIVNMRKQEVDLSTTIEMISSLKDKILSIKEEKYKDKFALELFEIIKYYTTVKINIKKKEDLSNILFSQVGDLNKRVDEVLRKENTESNNKCDEFIDKINYQKSIGGRR